MKKYNWKKTAEKFLRGGGLAFVGTVIAVYKGYDPKVVAPLFTALGEAIWNIVKFFTTNGKEK